MNEQLMVDHSEEEESSDRNEIDSEESDSDSEEVCNEGTERLKIFKSLDHG